MELCGSVPLLLGFNRLWGALVSPEGVPALLMSPVLPPGFPYRFIKKFTFGFTRRWKEYVEEFLEERRR